MWDSPIAKEHALPEKALHEAHSIIEMPLEIYITDEELAKNETPVTLLTKDSKIIAQKAYIHHQLYKTAEARVFKIEINHKDLKRLGEKISDEVIALPFIEQKTKLVSGEKNYEYSF